ncbi:MAG: hypothetical protein OES24_12150 [Acidimicrobiia bacterium]|nr:hypothetical protein [Acidimicrobiia bacterium]
MKSHRRLRADRAGRRTTAFRCRPAIAPALALVLLATGCGSDPAAESTLATPPRAEQADQILSDTIDALAIIEHSAAGDADDDDVPDYTAAELEVLLDTAAIDDEVLDTPEPEPLESGSPEAAIEAIEAELDEPTGGPRAGTPILDQVPPLDDAPAGTTFGIRDGRRINEVGEANRLDEQAALACGNVEIALTALDDGQPDEAVDHLRDAATMAADTSVTAMDPWSSILDQTATDVAAANPSNGTAWNSTASNGTAFNAVVSALLAFLTTCTQGGYEL